jgi:glucose-6-phosphate dehydrogenase assembly protein OpcA
VRLVRKSGPIELIRPDGRTGSLTQPGQPERRVALARRAIGDCLSEELRRLDADETYHGALTGLADITRGRAPAGRAAK